jgi:hypothetical protein
VLSVKQFWRHQILRCPQDRFYSSLSDWRFVQELPEAHQSETIKNFVEFNALFIPFAILNEHLKGGLAKCSGKFSFPAVCWEDYYAEFCMNVPFDSTSLSNRKKEILTLAIVFERKRQCPISRMSL